MPVVRVCFKQGHCHKIYKNALKDCLLLVSIFYMVFISGGAQSAAISGLLEVSDSIGGIGAVNINSINAIYNKDGITIWEVTPNANYPHTSGLKFYAKLDDNSDRLSILLSSTEEQASLRGLIPSLYRDENCALSTTPDEYHYCYEYTKSKTLIYAVLMDTFSDLKAKSAISQGAALTNNPSYKCSFTDKVFILGYYISAAEYDQNWLCFHNWPWGDGNDVCKYHPAFHGCEYSDGWVSVDLNLNTVNINNYYIYGGVYNDNGEESRISLDNVLWLRQVNHGGKRDIRYGKANIPSKFTLYGRKTWSVTSAMTWMAIDADSVGATGHITGAGQTNVDRPEELDVLAPISLTRSPLNWLSEFPDLSIVDNDITVSPSEPRLGDSVLITATIHNLGDEDAPNVIVRFNNMSGIIIDEVVIPSIAARSTAQASIQLNPLACDCIGIIADPDNYITETVENNNGASKCFDMVLADTNFRPSINGFAFQNFIFPVNANCLGMSFAARNYYLNGVLPQCQGPMPDFLCPEFWDIIYYQNSELWGAHWTLINLPFGDSLFYIYYNYIKLYIQLGIPVPVLLGGNGQHAVLAYKISDSPAGKKIYVYDPNSPGLECSFTLVPNGPSNYAILGGIILDGYTTFYCGDDLSTLMPTITDVSYSVACILECPADVELLCPDGSRIKKSNYSASFSEYPK